jgi:hypothetical protein
MSKSRLYPSWYFKWDPVELESLVGSGVFTKVSDQTEHVALHPFWLSNPLKGITDSLDQSLATWRSR